MIKHCTTSIRLVFKVSTTEGHVRSQRGRGAGPFKIVFSDTDAEVGEGLVCTVHVGRAVRHWSIKYRAKSLGRL